MNRVLVVEDHADTREVLCQLLAELGYIVAGVESAERGLHELRSRAYDVLVSDYWLVGGESGGWLIAQSRAQNVGVPSLVCTGERAAPDVPSDVVVLRKPIDIGDLITHVEKLAQAAPASRLSSQMGSPACVDLVFYMTTTPASIRGLRNLRRFLARYSPERFTLRVTDVSRDPSATTGAEHVAFTPMLVKVAPGRVERLLGDLRDTRPVEDMFARDAGPHERG
jgi:DNA-binding NtrC family response regulator